MYHLLTTFLREARRRNKLLFLASIILTFMFLLFLAAFGFCGAPPVAEICYWLKPFKFSISFALYLFTLGWLMEYLRPIWSKQKIEIVSLSLVVLIIIEMAAIFLQSIQHSRLYAHLQLSSHTNETIAEILPLITTIMILINTALVIYVACYFFLPISLTPKLYLWSIRIGFIVMILSCFLGLYLLLRYGKVAPSHTSFELPFSQIASTRSNLITLHFFGLHSLQLFPLLGYYVNKRVAYCIIGLLTLVFLGFSFYFLYQSM